MGPTGVCSRECGGNPRQVPGDEEGAVARGESRARQNSGQFEETRGAGEREGEGASGAEVRERERRK